MSLILSRSGDLARENERFSAFLAVKIPTQSQGVAVSEPRLGCQNLPPTANPLAALWAETARPLCPGERPKNERFSAKSTEIAKPNIIQT